MNISPKFVILCVCALAVFVSGETDIASLSCLKCLCVASTGCDENAGCDGPVCGPYRISLGYWLDAGAPKVDDELYLSNEASSYSEKAYRDCANDLTCASKAVVAYMQRYAKDCDGDDVIDCDDFARIHRNGPLACSQPLDDKFKQLYEKCMQIADY